ncbi:MAG: hypothetical protein DWQ07_15760 [Chloroflexi bacterium]|nr:MAG: hypothetical protein DWQ07_15760 [Chloroflexota bacterium]MBL1195207.1 hypothetical protein [Chloroflexota bacterium]NOH12492.1 hypothetical protein [Chloroflexota bacterium]
MGAWGVGLFSDDDACGVRDNYRDYLGDGLSNEDATHRLMSEWGIRNFKIDVENTVFWLALASVQWQAGRLDGEVKNNAIEIIDSRLDLERWGHDRKLQKRREGVLAKLKAKLESPQPKKKKFKKRFRNYSDWNKGNVISYELLSGNYILLRVIGFHTDKGGATPIFEILDWVGEHLPSKWWIWFAPIRIGKIESQKVKQILIGRLKEAELPKGRVRLILKRARVRQKPEGYWIALWHELDNFLDKHFDLR